MQNAGMVAASSGRQQQGVPRQLFLPTNRQPRDLGTSKVSASAPRAGDAGHCLETEQERPSSVAGSSREGQQVPGRVPSRATIAARALSVYHYDSDGYHPEGPLDARVGCCACPTDCMHPMQECSRMQEVQQDAGVQQECNMSAVGCRSAVLGMQQECSSSGL
jgi:hypothetical protein